VVATFRGSDLNPCRSVSRTRSFAGRLLSQLAALAASEVICVSERLRRRLWWRPVHIIPSGVDTSLFSPRARDEARAELGWPIDERVVLFNAGGDPETKRLDLARKATDLARHLLDGIRLEVLDGNAPPSRIPTYLNAADCVLVTSRFEGSPNIVKEALACNLPVVSVDVGDVRQRLQGISPSVIAAADPDAIARGLVQILSAPERSNGLAGVGEISSATTARRTVDVYRAVIERSRRKTIPAAARNVVEGA
jgi:teichuronic acid biosynthesis glycosyltransferase TuaC